MAEIVIQLEEIGRSVETDDRCNKPTELINQTQLVSFNSVFAVRTSNKQSSSHSNRLPQDL